VLNNDNLETDEEFMGFCDKLGENYGALTSYVLGYDKRFKGVSHKYRFY